MQLAKADNHLLMTSLLARSCSRSSKHASLHFGSRFHLKDRKAHIDYQALDCLASHEFASPNTHLL